MKFPKGLRRREEVSHPVFFVLCDVLYCVESRLFFLCFSRISMVSFILYNCVLLQHGSLGGLGV